MAQALAYLLVEVLAPDVSALAERPYSGGREGAARRHQVPLRSPDEAPRLVGLVELQAVNVLPVQSLPALQVFVEQPHDGRERVHHEAAADQPGGVGKPVGMGPRRRVEQQPRGAYPVGAQDRHRRRLEVLVALAVHVGRPGRQAPRVDLDAPDAGAGDQLGAQFQGVRPVRKVGAGLGQVGASPQAGGELHARLEPAVAPGGYGVRVGPPVPTELIVALAYELAHAPDGSRR